MKPQKMLREQQEWILSYTNIRYVGCFKKKASTMHIKASFI